MENRFGVKDLVNLILIAIVIVMIGLCMHQYDRQWDVINQADLKIDHLTADLARIQRILAGGLPTQATTQPIAGSDDLKAGFERILAPQSNPDYARGDAVYDTFTAAPAKLTPLISQELTASQVQSVVLDSLMNRDPDTLAWIPGVAKRFHVSDDQLTIEFELRKGVVFSDGSPLTADDVVFTMDLERNDRIEAPRARAYLDKLDRVEKTGDFSVRFVFKEPYFKSMEVAAGTAILSRKFYSQFSPKEFNESTGLLLGSGPYRLADPKNWRPVPGAPIELVRNERYWGIPPAPDRMVWKMIGNPSARVTSFRNGEIDSYSPTPEQYNTLCQDKDLVARTHHFQIDVPNAPYRYIAWNQKLNGKPTRFADKRVRQAMTMLLDRQAIVNDIVRGYGSVNTSCFSSLTPQADPSVKPWPYDVAKAQQLLADAGYHIENGVLLGSDGQPFAFELNYNTANSVLKQVASYIHDSFARAGIAVDIKPGELSVLISKLKTRDFEVYLGGWSGVLESDPHQIFCTDAIAGTGDNFVNYSNPQLDTLVNQARSTVKDDARNAIWHQVHRIISEDQPYTFLYIEKNLSFVDGRFKNVMPVKTGVNSFEEWYVPLAEQKYKE
jgi:peptide/nickel transport system substrate-binding protein